MVIDSTLLDVELVPDASELRGDTRLAISCEIFVFAYNFEEYEKYVVCPQMEMLPSMLQLPRALKSCLLYTSDAADE